MVYWFQVIKTGRKNTESKVKLFECKASALCKRTMRRWHLSERTHLLTSIADVETSLQNVTRDFDSSQEMWDYVSSLCFCLRAKSRKLILVCLPCLWMRESNIVSFTTAGFPLSPRLSSASWSVRCTSGATSYNMEWMASVSSGFV